MSLQDILELDPTIKAELYYATEKNFIGKALYPKSARALLRRPVAEALVQAQKVFLKNGFLIKVWDAYRPFSIQEIFWKAMPDPRYIAKPVKKGDVLVEGSVHNRGAAVDLTLCDLKGVDVEMPTGFDEFTERAHRNYQGASKAAMRHCGFLEKVMTDYGFIGFPTEWWHFNWHEVDSFELLDMPFPD